jgi:hypothetical protein
MIKKIMLVVGLLAVIALSGCVGNSLNSAPADYVKTVSAVKDGEGFQIYFILADKNGDMTTSDGSYVLNIMQNKGTLFETVPANLTKGDFEKRSVGMGNFAHDVILHLVGRLPYDKMYRMPKSGTGEVIIKFTTPDKRVLEGKETVFF